MTSLPIRPAEISDPYLERSNRDQGVRPHTKPKSPQAWMVTARSQVVGPLPFTASLHTSTLTKTLRHRLPWVSTGLYVVGQLVLASAIAVGRVDPIVGAAVCLLWMTCGLSLIAAQFTSDQPKARLHRQTSDAFEVTVFDDGQRNTTRRSVGGLQ